MPVGQKRGRATVHDFVIKTDDADGIKQALGFKASEFKDFVTKLAPEQFMQWQEYCLRQKNFDRVIEYTVEELQLKKEFEVNNNNNN